MWKRRVAHATCAGLLCGAATTAIAQPAQEDSLDDLLGGAEAAPAGQEAPAQAPSEGESAAAAEPYAETIPVATKEQPVPPPQRTAPKSRLVEEIVVTAQKREENLKDVPISITAFSAGQLDAKGVFDSGDLPKLTPGLTVTTQVGFTSTFLRGVGSDAFILGDPSVVTYVDGVYFPFALGQVQDFGAIERMEVLKGPQGTLFGRNALGGAIKIETRKPSLEKPEVSFQTVYGSFDSSRTRVHVSIPVLETLALSASGFYNVADSHVDGTHKATREPLYRDQSDAYRFQAFWQPTDWFEAQASYYDLSQGSSGTYAVNTSPSLLMRLLGQQRGDPRAGINNEEIYYRNVNQTLNGSFKVSMPWFDVKVIGSDQYVANYQSYDFDGTGLPVAAFVSDPGFADVQTAELQVLSSADSWGSDWLEWILGAYFFKSHAGFEPAYLRAAAVDLEAGTLAGVPVPQGLLNIIRRVAGNSPISIPTGAVLNFVGLLDTDSTAYFGQATAKITDTVSLTLGGRFQSEDRLVDQSSSGVRAFNGSEIPLFNYSGHTNPEYRETTDSFDPKVSLNFRPTWEWLGSEPLLYANYQTATTSATFNVINIYDAPERVDGSKIKAYEVGLKTRLFDGLIDFNAAAFHYDIETPQVQIVSLLAGGAVRFENAGGQRIVGMDFDALIPVFSMDDGGGLVMTLSGAFLDTKYTSYENGSGFDQTTGLFTSNNDFTGNPIVRAPEFSGTLGLLQTFVTRHGPVELGADYYYNSGFYYLAQATPNVEEKAYGTLGASISFLYEPWNLRITAFGRNLLDEEYNLARFPTDFGTNDTIAPLATYGVRLNYDF